VDVGVGVNCMLQSEECRNQLARPGQLEFYSRWVVSRYFLGLQTKIYDVIKS
jgi:hypothetical protein